MESEDLRSKRLNFYGQTLNDQGESKPMSQKSLDKINIINKLFGYEPRSTDEAASKYQNFSLSEDSMAADNSFLNNAHLNEDLTHNSEIFSFLNKNDTTLVNDPMNTSSLLDLDLPFKIQYNSAYNIYDPKTASLLDASANPVQRNISIDSQANELNDKLIYAAKSVNLFGTTNDESARNNETSKERRKKSVDLKKLSSTGSSLTPSPSSTTDHQIKHLESDPLNNTSDLFATSTSSYLLNYHASNVNPLREESNGFEAKPPERKPTFSSNNGHSSSRYNNYRKNLYKLNGSINYENSASSQVFDEPEETTGPYKLLVRKPSKSNKSFVKQTSEESFKDYRSNPIDDADSTENLKKIYNEISNSLRMVEDDDEVFQKSKSYATRKNSGAALKDYSLNEISAYNLNEQNVSDLKANNMYQPHHEAGVKQYNSPSYLEADFNTSALEADEKKPPSKFDLTIDLSAVNDDDEEASYKQVLSDYYYVNPNKEAEEDESDSYVNSNQQFMSNFQHRASIQIKPDNIPNLCLDMFDDDKSASVNASLAKSMCQEIDYKKEMEMITKTKKIPTNESRDKTRFAKPKTVSKYILDSELIDNNAKSRKNSSSLAPLQTVSASVNPKVFQHQSSIIDSDGSRFSSASINIKQIPTADMHRKSAHFKTVPLSKSPTRAQISARENKELSRSKTLKLNKINLSRNRTSILSNKIKSIAINDQKQAERIENFYADPNNKSIDIHTKLDPIHRQISSNEAESDAQSKPGSRGKLEKSVSIETATASKPKPRLKTSESVYVKNMKSRSNSAISKYSLIDMNPPSSELEPGVAEMPPKGELFLSYSKFIAIEKNFKNQQMSGSEAEQNDLRPEPGDLPPRPKSSKPVLTRDSQKLAIVLHKVGVGEEDVIEESVNSFETKPLAIENGSHYSNSTSPDLTATNAESTFHVASTETFQPEVCADWLALPDEIWLKILGLLSQKDLVQFGRTCKAFNHLYIDNSLWRCITMKYKYEMCDEWLSWIGRRQPSELNIVQCSGNITLHAIADMFKNIGENLRLLNLSRCSNGSLSGDNFALQASIRCPNVTELDLSWTLLSNQTLKLIADSFRRIESINLSGCSMIQEEGFNCLLLKHGEFLRNLDISSCIHFSSNAILNIGVYCPNLLKLNISLCHRITNESIMEATPHFKSLKQIELKGIKNVKTNCVSMLVRKCANLEALGLADCVHIGDAAILEIVTYKPNIKYLDLNGCKKITDQSIRSISTFCSNLESLSLKATTATDTGLTLLANGKCTKTIKELNLSYLPVSDSALTKILESFSGIRNVQLYGCYNVKRIEEHKKSHSVCKFHI